MMYAIVLQTSAPADAPLFATLRALGNAANRIPGLWLVESTRSARQIRDLLKPQLAAGDRLFVARFDRNWSATNLGDGFGEWMQRRTYDPPAADPVTPIVATPITLLTQPNAAAPTPKSRPGVRPPPKR